ncbi:hypothetical protein [Flammeovirga kamogawensis]|uniref:Uncharacterized protein n=1 Tax=Flammeovirga kamogawensis TaxID=373891 RepID=A0ABX8H033_9BACT|nr:hypothetical protein [Flammeovirga kamogawensis]MBB6459123.1 hypothetical protein [Flammeovirga kamogawensis]QWG08692.1 hypothetical protein KM029_07065 [Flammeovirga kamogawensis]TRX66985.1 hypothetical protein EO216_02110 [Flammeovirga kamogawensis]
MNKHTLCFEKVISGKPVKGTNGQLINFFDQMILHLDIKGTTVTGTFDWSPSEKDHFAGTLVGTIQDDLIKAVYTYAIDGVDIKEERFIKLDKESAYFRVGGKMRLKDGVYIYTNEENRMQFGRGIPRSYCKS